jgi:hypothetical protein
MCSLLPWYTEFPVYLWLIRFKQRNILGAIFFSNFLSFSAMLWRSGALGKIIYTNTEKNHRLLYIVRPYNSMGLSSDGCSGLDPGRCCFLSILHSGIVVEGCTSRIIFVISTFFFGVVVVGVVTNLCEIEVVEPNQFLFFP